MKKSINIFISSPGDVQYERNIAENTIRELGQLYSKDLKIEALMWENLPLSAASTFQEGIDYFLNEKPIDVAVFILWSRLGTPLSHKFKKPDGTDYQSGTEYEFDLMMRLREKNKEMGKDSPLILAYVKDSDSIPAGSTTNELRNYLTQRELLQSFIQEHFHDEATNSNYAYTQFGEHNSFEQRFRNHIKNIIDSVVGETGNVKEWEGNPYVGLASFSFEQSPIFFGRKKLIFDTAAKLVDVNDEKIRKSLIVLGESGSGKSSFIKAGLLPFFCANKDNKSAYISVTPSQFGGKMYHGLIDRLVEKLPFLSDNPFISEIREGGKSTDNYEHLRFAIDNNPHKDLFIHIDQFEELFDETQHTEEERLQVICLLYGIASTQRVSVIITMRSDFYFWLSRENELSKLKSICVTVDIPPVSVSEIAEIVEEPARKACLKWERDGRGEELSKQIISDALRIKELPLIEFALSELYERRNESEFLTIDAYNKIGKLEGAVVNYADGVYNKLSDKEKDALKDLLGYVVAESTSNKGNYVRKTSLRDDTPQDSVTQGLIGKLISAHLLVSDKDASGRATITVVHEILIRSWNVIADWVDAEKDFLKRNGYYEKLAQYWVESGCSERKLISGRTPLLEAEYHLFKNERRLSKDVCDFLKLSIKKENRGGLVWRIIVFVSVLFAIICAVYCSVTSSWTEVMDLDTVEYFGLDDLHTCNIILLFGGILLMIIHGIIIRIKCLPEYKTVRQSVSTWFLILLLFMTDAVLSIVQGGEVASILIGEAVFSVPALIVLLSFLREYSRRKKWKNGYVPYLWSDITKFKVKTIFVSAIAAFGFLVLSAMYMGAISDKEDKLQQRAKVTDTLFDGLERIKGNLSEADRIYVNEERRDYLEANFEDELRDTICDSRELEYALCLLNLYSPIKSKIYLYPDENWIHHLMWIICNDRAGEQDGIARDIEAYFAEGNRYDEYASNSTGNLIWISEKIGRFDLAEKALDAVRDTLPNMLSNPAYSVNIGHISLSKGDMNGAVDSYGKAIRTAASFGLNGELVRHSIQNDFYIFSRSGIFSNSLLERASRMVGVTFESAAIPYSTPLLNDDYLSMLIGIWRWDATKGNYVTLQVEEDVPYLTYNLYDSDDNNLARSVSALRIASSTEGNIIWEELDLYSDEHFYGKLLSIDDESFELEVINNSNPADNGQIRKYYKQ